MDRRNTLYMYDVASRKLIFSNLLGAEVKVSRILFVVRQHLCVLILMALQVMAMSFARSPALFSVASSRGVDFYTEDVGGYMGAGRMVNFKRNQVCCHHWLRNMFNARLKRSWTVGAVPHDRKAVKELSHELPNRYGDGGRAGVWQRARQRDLVAWPQLCPGVDWSARRVCVDSALQVTNPGYAYLQIY